MTTYLFFDDLTVYLHQIDCSQMIQIAHKVIIDEYLFGNLFMKTTHLN